MPKFIPLYTFQSFYVKQSDLLEQTEYEKFLSSLKSEEGARVAQEKNISHQDFLAFVESLEDAQNLVFYGWVEQNGALMDFLMGKAELHSYADRLNHLNHQWSKQFIAFISPFVVDLLLRYAGERDTEKLAILFSYLKLVQTDDKVVVESQLFQPIQEKIDHLVSKARTINDEQELIDLVTPLCDLSIINSVNGLSKGSYATKLEYVDGVLSAIKSEGCTVRFANWILKQMELVKLNNEHQYKITDLRKELRSGELEVKNHGRGRMPIRWGNVIMLFVVVLILGGAGYIILEKPFSEVEEQEYEDATAFKEFTKDERKTIDSLLQTMSNSDDLNELEVDPGLFMDDGMTLTLRNGFKNPLMEKIYADYSKDADLKEQFYEDSCKSESFFKRYPGVFDLSRKQGKVDAVLRNESEYDMIVYVSSGSANGSVYSMLVKQNKTIVFKMDKYDILTVVAGNAYSRFEAPAGALDEMLPSDNYAYHFCDTDANFGVSLNSSRQLKSSKNDQAKFMVVGGSSSYFRVVDVYGVTDAY